jgi:hypothetical protein
MSKWMNLDLISRSSTFSNANRQECSKREERGILYLRVTIGLHSESTTDWNRVVP